MPAKVAAWHQILQYLDDPASDKQHRNAKEHGSLWGKPRNQDS